MLGILDKHGFKYAVPEGAYYVMADFRHLGRGDDDMAFAYWLIAEIGVATVPGSSFLRFLSCFGPRSGAFRLSEEGRNARRR